ncbi:zinc finger MYM-type protein 1-like, partial [Aphis craccivora]
MQTCISLYYVIDISLNKNHTPQQPIPAFNSNYYELYNWIEYSVLNDEVGNYVFIDRGFNGWKNQSVCLKIHNESDRHKSSIEKWTLYLSTKQNDNCIANLLTHPNYKILKKIQGLAFRGHNEERESLNRGNLIELLQTFGDKNTILKMQSRYGHYTSHEYQNDLIS